MLISLAQTMNIGIMVACLIENTINSTVGGMKMASIEDRVKGIVVELLGVEEEKVVTGANFRDDLEADSLDLVELIMAFEEEFGGEISDEDAQKIETVGQAVDYIKSNME